MAQIDELFEQIDQELEAERMQKFWENNRDYIIAGVIVFFIGLGGYVWWKEHHQQQQVAAANQFMTVVQTLGANQWDDAATQLEQLRQTYPGSGYATLGPLLQAQALVAKGDAKGAADRLLALANDPATPPLLREFALLNCAYTTATFDGKAALKLLEGLAPTSTFQPLSLELQGAILAANGDHKTARERLKKALELQPSADLQQRVTNRLRTLEAAP